VKLRMSLSRFICSMYQASSPGMPKSIDDTLRILKSRIWGFFLNSAGKVLASIFCFGLSISHGHTIPSGYGFIHAHSIIRSHLRCIKKRDSGYTKPSQQLYLFPMGLGWIELLKVTPLLIKGTPPYFNNGFRY